MQSRFILVLVVTFLFCALTGMAQDDARIQKKKWFKGEEGYKEALALQEKLGTDIFLYFYRNDIKNQKGLCRWWEKGRMNSGKVKKHLEQYIKVEVEVPLKDEEKKTFGAFQFRSCPTIFVVKPKDYTGYPERISVFEWPNGKPKLKKDEDIIAQLEEASAKKNEPSNNDW